MGRGRRWRARGPDTRTVRVAVVVVASKKESGAAVDEPSHSLPCAEGESRLPPDEATAQKVLILTPAAEEPPKRRWEENQTC